MSVDSNLENKFQVRWQLFVAIFALVAVNALWGLSFPIIKSMNLQMEHAAGLESSQIDSSLRVAFTAGMIAMRFAVAFLLLCFLGYKLVLNASMAEWRAGAIVGLFFYFGLMLQVLGLATIPASRSGFLTSLTAVFTPLFSALVLRRVPTSNVWIGGLIALLGVSLLTGLLQVSQWQLSIASDAMSVQLDCLIAVMRNDPLVREKLLAAATTEEIQAIAHSYGQLLGETIDVNPVHLREAIRPD